MMAEDDPLKFIRERLNVLTLETPRHEVRNVIENLIPLLAKLEEVKFEGFWADLDERLHLKGKFFTALRRKVGAIRKELKRSAPVQEGVLSPSPEDELKTLKPIVTPLLQSPNILEKVAEALRRQGLAGQVREAKILYLAVTARVLKVKVLVNVVVKGPSSGGKSYLVELVLEELFPPSSFYALSAMSEKALAYSQEPVAHRYMVIYEAAGLGSDFAQYLMRSLLSEGRLRYETVEKTKAGFVPRLIEREGPTGLIVTTTRAGLHPENETRMLTLEVDDSPRQTMEVLKAHAEGENPKGGDIRAVDMAPFKALQRILELEKPQAVVPFAKALAQGCDPTAVRLRRDFKTVLTLVKAHTILHASHRKRDEHGRVIATIEDYAVVYDLVADLVSYGTGQKVSEKMRETVEAVGHLAAGKSDGVTYREIGKRLGIDESAARRRVNVAINKGYLVNLETRKGCAAKIVPGEPLPDAKEVLPYPNSLSDTPPEPTADPPSGDDSCGKTEGYGRQPEEPTDCQPPTDAPAGSGTKEPEGGQAVGKESVESGAYLNTAESQDFQPESAGRHENQGDIGDGDVSEFGLVQCADCQNFTSSQVGPGEKGVCQLQSTSWNGQIFQPLYDMHPCDSFKEKGVENDGAQAERQGEFSEDADPGRG